MFYKRENSLTAFLLLVFLLPLVCSLCIRYISIFQSGFLRLLVYGLQAASPSIAVILLLLYNNKRIGLKNYLRDKYHTHFSGFIYLFALLLPFFLLFLTKLISNKLIGNNTLFSPLTLGNLLIISWALIAEELGWRGFLQPELERRAPLFLVPLITGLIWGLWHYHFYIINATDAPFLLLIIGCVMESYGYSLLTKLANGSIIPVSIAHFSYNLFFHLFALSPSANNASKLPYLINTMFALVYVLLYVFYKKTDRPKKLFS